MESCLHYSLYEIPEAPGMLVSKYKHKNKCQNQMDDLVIVYHFFFFFYFKTFPLTGEVTKPGCTLNRRVIHNSSVLSWLSELKSLSTNDQKI